MDCRKSGLEEGWVALEQNPSVFNKFVIKDRHVLKGVWVVGKRPGEGLGGFGGESFSSW